MLLVNGHDYWPGITISKAGYCNNTAIHGIYSAVEPHLLLTPGFLDNQNPLPTYVPAITLTKVL